jgi:hypothetical protein
MHRLLFIVTLSLAPTEAVLADPDGDSDCRADDGADEMVLRGDEFQIAGYDSDNGVVALRVARELEPVPGRRGRVRLVGTDEDLHLPMLPASFQLALEAGQSQALQLVMKVHRVEAPTRPVVTREDCADVMPDRVELKSGQLVLAERDLHRPLQPEPIIEVRVRVGPQHAQVPGSALDATVLRQVQFLAETCLRQALGGTPMVRGALTLELRTSPIGQPVRPRIVVDGLINKPLSHCLVRTLFEDPLWKRVTPGTHLFVPLYFMGSRTLPPQDEDAPPGLP